MKKNQQKKTKTVLIRRLSDELWRYFTPKNTTFSVALYFREQKENKTTPSKYGIICLYSPEHPTIIRRAELST